MTCGALEHHVLEQVGDAGDAGPLVGRQLLEVGLELLELGGPVGGRERIVDLTLAEARPLAGVLGADLLLELLLLAMISWSRTASVVPTMRLPLNIMCSKKWATPVIPGRSLAEPTCATEPPMTVACAGRETTRNRMPFPSVNSADRHFGLLLGPRRSGDRG